jgi:hypothetical protein
LRKAEVYLEYQPLIHEPPVNPAALYQNAASNDESTVTFWQHIWLGNATANKQTFGSFGANSVGQEFNKFRYQPAIIAGSGPSLKINAHELKNRGGIPLISCLHNFHYFEDLGLAPEYYITLDAGEVTQEEVYEGGTKTPDEYWEMTKDRTLIAFISTSPNLLKKWKGKILFFNSPIPSPELVKKIDDVETFNCFLSTGGNVLGACLYFSKAILGCTQTIFVGADFSFGYDRRFHSWDSKYDKNMGQTMRVMDVYGNKVHTWASYYGFKQYFDSVSLRLPGTYYNCTEGGCLGAYAQGNLSTFKYMDLRDCLRQLNINLDISDQMTNSLAEPKKILYS